VRGAAGNCRPYRDLKEICGEGVRKVLENKDEIDQLIAKANQSKQ